MTEYPNEAVRHIFEAVRRELMEVHKFWTKGIFPEVWKKATSMDTKNERLAVANKPATNISQDLGQDNKQAFTK